MKWQDQYQTKPQKCLHLLEYPNRKSTKRPAQLTLASLMGAFFLLFFGYCLSVMVFMLELFRLYVCKRFVRNVSNT